MPNIGALSGYFNVYINVIQTNPTTRCTFIAAFSGNFTVWYNNALPQGADHSISGMLTWYFTLLCKETKILDNNQIYRTIQTGS